MTESPVHNTHVRVRRLHRVFRDLVDHYSPSGKEHEVVDYVKDLLEQHGFPVRMREVADGRCNVEIAVVPENLQLALFGHLDTVSAFDVEHYGFKEADGRVFGLGTADMKGGCAALIEACLAAGPTAFQSGRLGLFLVVGEEETGDGTHAVLNDYPSIPAAIVAEPTDLHICAAHYGYIEMLLRTFGTRRHASMAGREYNAIHAMLKTLLHLGECVENDFPQTVLNIRDLHSSEAGFAVPDRCGSWIDVHIPPEKDPKIVAEELRRIADDILTATKTSRHELSFPTLARGYRVSDNHPLVIKLQTACEALNLPTRTDVFRSHSDANLLHGTGCAPVIFGPGQLARAHTRDESVDFTQVVRAAEIYLSLLR